MPLVPVPRKGRAADARLRLHANEIERTWPSRGDEADRLVARFGADIALPDVLIALAACERRKDFFRPCGARFTGLAASKGLKTDAARRSDLFGEASDAETGFAPHGRKCRPPPPVVQERRERAAGVRVGKGVRSERASHRRDNARSLPLRNIVPAAHAEKRDSWRPAPAFSGQKPANTRHCAKTPFDGTKRRRITRRRFRWRWLRSLRPPARSGLSRS